MNSPCEKCGHNPPQTIEERLADVRAELSVPYVGYNHLVAALLKLVTIVEEIERRPSIVFNPNPYPTWPIPVGPEPTNIPNVPYTPPIITPTVGDPASWPYYPRVICGGNTCDQSKDTNILAINSASNSAPSSDPTGYIEGSEVGHGG